MTELNIAGWPDAIPANRGTLLDAALKAGAPIPYQCRAGECGTCKCRLISGQINELNSLPGVLTNDERSRGWILACRSSAKSDVTLELPTISNSSITNFPIAAQQLVGHVENIEWVATDTVRLLVHTPRPLLFLAGQYVTLAIDGLPTRSFSPANLPRDDMLEFFIRILPNGLVSQHIAANLVRGSSVRIEGPYGTACLAPDFDRSLLLAGGGTGLAPMLSILRAAASSKPEILCCLYAGFRDRRGSIAQTAVNELVDRMPNLSANYVFSDEVVDSCETGFIAPVIAGNHTDLSQFDVFIAGPPPMVESVEKQARQLGALNIQTDPFLSSAPDETIGSRGFGGLVGRLTRSLFG